MKISYSVTFEFPTAAPLSHRGTVEGSTVSVCMSRAVTTAEKALHPRRWSSVVCVILERLAEERRSRRARRCAEQPEGLLRIA
jgi:hypothetical protein